MVGKAIFAMLIPNEVSRVVNERLTSVHLYKGVDFIHLLAFDVMAQNYKCPKAV